MCNVIDTSDAACAKAVRSLMTACNNMARVGDFISANECQAIARLIEALVTERNAQSAQVCASADVPSVGDCPIVDQRSDGTPITPYAPDGGPLAERV